MSSPQKIMKPIKASFTQIINAVADGKGVKSPARDKAARKYPIQASESPRKPKS